MYKQIVFYSSFIYWIYNHQNNQSKVIPYGICTTSTFSNKHIEFSTSTSTYNIKKLCIFNIFPFLLCSLSSVIWNLWGRILIFKLNRVYFPLTVITAIPPSLGYKSMKLMWKTSVSLYSLLPSPDTNHSRTVQAELFLCAIHMLPLLALQQRENFKINTWAQSWRQYLTVLRIF